VRSIAAEVGCSPAQLALAWLLARNPDIFAIPGTKRVKYLEENVAALDITVTADVVQALEAALPKDAAAGTRYPEFLLRGLEQD
jgi:aryl-alcohol dehydrogenase-like predicted oxidoreductase